MNAAERARLRCCPPNGVCHGKGLVGTKANMRGCGGGCGGSGVIYCCDMAGAEDIPEADEAWFRKARYIDPAYPERACDHCGKPYRGPAVYCSFACAEADA